MKVSIKNINGTIHVYSPFNSEFVSEAKRIKGRFNGDEKCWCFDERNLDLVKEILLSIYGTDGQDQQFVDVEVTVKKTIKSELSPVCLAGREIASAHDKKSGARVGNNISFVKNSPTSGGSAKYWTTEIPGGAVFRIFDLPAGAAKLLSACDDIEYKIISGEQSKEQELAHLKMELNRILARIAELEAQ